MASDSGAMAWSMTRRYNGRRIATRTRGVVMVPHEPETVAMYEARYEQVLRENFGDAEAARFKAMKPLRDFIRRHYRPVLKRAQIRTSEGVVTKEISRFAPFVLLRRQDDAS